MPFDSLELVRDPTGIQTVRTISVRVFHILMTAHVPPHGHVPHPLQNTHVALAGAKLVPARNKRGRSR